MYNYVVTASKASAVSKTAIGSFLGPDERNLLLAKCTRIEIFRLSDDGLMPVVELPIYGRIAVMKLFRNQGDNQDQLLLLTERYKFCVLRWNPASGECDTVAGGDVRDRIGRPTDNNLIGVVDPQVRCFGLHLYERLFKIIPTDYKKEAFNIRVGEQIKDIQFLHGYYKPTIAVLYSDAADEGCHLKTLEILIKEKDFGEGPWSQDNLENTCSKLVAVPEPFGGVLLFGEQLVAYFSPKGDFTPIPIPPAVIEAVGRVDDNGSRFLVGDHKGHLSMLVLENDGKQITRLQMEFLGVTSIASDISYLDNGYVYIGSRFGDSQLLRLCAERNETTGYFIEIVESFTNLGPIVDFCVVDLERQGQGQIVTCSGAYKDGSLRVIRNGISITEMASVELPGIKDMFSLKRNSSERFHSYLMQSFTTETRVLELVGAEEMVEAELPGLEAELTTLYAGNMQGDLIIQVTSRSARLLDCNSMMLVNEWAPPVEYRISVASGNSTQLLMGTTGGNLILCEINPVAKKIVEVAHKKLENEISCLDISPLGENPNDKANLCAIGLWNEVAIKLLHVPSLSVTHTETLGSDTIARSILLTNMEGSNQVIVALGDGHIFTYKIKKETSVIEESSGLSLMERRRVSVGTQPASLSKFYNRGTAHVFVACDRPTVLHASSGGSKLLCSNVNLRETTRVCCFDSEAFPDCLAIANEGSLQIGSVDDIQKLHIRTILLGEQPRRIAHLERSRCFVVITSAFVLDEDGNEYENYYIKLIDETKFDVLHSFKLDMNECGCSIISMSFAADPGVSDTTNYFLVGTAYALPDEDEPIQGRILVFSANEGRMNVVSEKEVKGAVYCLTELNGKVLAGVNSRVQLLRWTEGEDGTRALTEECSHIGHMLALYIQSRGDFIVVGDIQKSISLLMYKPAEGAIEEIARDYDCNWMTAVEMFDDDNYLGAENAFNIFSVMRNNDATSEEDRTRLEKSGEFHLGEFVNRFRHGSLVMQIPESESPALQTIIYGTVNGVIGIIARLEPESFKFFLQVQHAMLNVVHGIGGLKHEEWRMFCNDRRQSYAKNFLDGDLIERFLDLKRPQMEKVAAAANVSIEELSKRIEDLTRLH